jgi:hypothetical protein
VIGDYDTINEFLTRIGHDVALVATKPVPGTNMDGRPPPRTTILWPKDLDDIADHALWLNNFYFSVYINLNPLLREIDEADTLPGNSVKDRLIARRSRLLIDLDAHGDITREQAFDEKEAVKERFPNPLIESDTGNGFALIYEIDFPNNDQSKTQISTLLKNLHAEVPSIDTTVFTAGRLTRCVGTLNRDRASGDRIPTRLLNEHPR